VPAEQFAMLLTTGIPEADVISRRAVSAKPLIAEPGHRIAPELIGL
jgi:hypothetical protein